MATTAARDLETVRTAMANGVLRYLLKPFTYAAFEEKIGQYLAYRNALSGEGDAVSQRDVDRAVASLRPAPHDAPQPRARYPRPPTWWGGRSRTAPTA